MRQNRFFTGWLLLLISFLSCINSGAKFSQANIYEDLTAAQFTRQIKAMPDGSYIILDVRTPEEYEEMHVKGAVNLNFYNPDFRDELNKFDKTKAYFLYCRTGNRSSKVLKMMQEDQFKTVYHLKNGITRDTAQLMIE